MEPKARVQVTSSTCHLPPDLCYLLPALLHLPLVQGEAAYHYSWPFVDSNTGASIASYSRMQ